MPIAIGGFGVGALAGVFFADGEPALTRFLIVLGIGMALGGLGGAVSLLPATFRTGPPMQESVRGLDRADRRAVLRAVSAGRPIGPRDSESARRAADWARIAVRSLPIALAQVLLLYAGIAGPQLPNLVSEDVWSAGFARVFIAALVVTAVGFAIVFTRRIRGVRRYLEAVEGR